MLLTIGYCNAIGRGRNHMDENTRVIVIGASAGGVEALLRIAPGLASDLAAPILLVLHIGAYRSQLPELLNHRGPLQAVFAQTGMVPRPATIYVAPPDQHLLLEGGVLRLFRGPKEHHARPAINPLFRSAALDCGSRTVGVVLTGMLDDGTAGLQAISACGGTAVVQDPADAAEPSMPRSALMAVAVDHVVSLDRMANLLNSLAQPREGMKAVTAPDWLRVEHAISVGEATMRDLATIGSPSSFTCPDCGGALFELTEARPMRFLCHTGHAFSLRSLAWSHEQVADEALWSGLRALQEKEAILRRLAAIQIGEAPGSEATTLAKADTLARYILDVRALVTTAPASAPIDGLAEVRDQ